jgi:hypothetical protein
MHNYAWVDLLKIYLILKVQGWHIYQSPVFKGKNKINTSLESIFGLKEMGW